jgi:Glycosyl hydrolase family 1
VKHFTVWHNHYSCSESCTRFGGEGTDDTSSSDAGSTLRREWIVSLASVVLLVLLRVVLCSRDMVPLATLHHFVHPQWFEDLGGFEKEENLEHYLAFAKVCFK